MNRLVLQQQTVLSTRPVPSRHADLASVGKGKPDAQSAHARDITADRPATFARALRTKRKAADTSEQHERPRIDQARETDLRSPEGKERLDAVSPGDAAREPLNDEDLTPDAVQAAMDKAARPFDPQGVPPVPLEVSHERYEGAPKTELSTDLSGQSSPNGQAPAALAVAAGSSTQSTEQAGTPAAAAQQLDSTDASGAHGSTSDFDAKTASVTSATPSVPGTSTRSSPGAANTQPQESKQGTPASADSDNKVASQAEEADPQPSELTHTKALPVGTAVAGDTRAPIAANLRPSNAAKGNAAVASSKPQDRSTSSEIQPESSEQGESEPVTETRPLRPVAERAIASSDAGTRTDPSVPTSGQIDLPATQPTLAPLHDARAPSTPASNDLAGSAPAPTVADSRESTPLQTSSHSPRTLDLLGRLNAEPFSGTHQSASQAGAATPEFQRALHAQVQRGIEQAASQAAASGAWAGADAAGSGSVLLRLHPANLGMLRVYLRMDSGGAGSSGGVKARFEVSSSRAKGILDSSIESLRSALRERGLSVAEVTVTDMPTMPERGFGLPPVAETARDAGAAFAENEQSEVSAVDATHGGVSAGGARNWSSAESGDMPMNESGWEGGGQPVVLAALSPTDSALTIGEDGRVSVNALV